MTRYRTTQAGIAILLLASVAACGGGGDNTQVGPAGPVADEAGTVQAPADTGFVSPGKPTAPISIDYEIVNKPIVGAPVQINITVSSSEGPVRVRYSINDASALQFQEDQVEEEEIPEPGRAQPRQLRVVPLREGRVFVNVSAEVETAGGAMIRSMAIPLRVGAAPDAPAANGAMAEGPGGESVITMPAEERED
jgi:hypothetical protein